MTTQHTAQRPPVDPAAAGRRLEELDARRPDETPRAYGARALHFLICTGITATLPDEALDLAEHFAVLAVASRDIAPAALARISDARHDIAAALRNRRAPAENSAQAASAGAGREKPNEGPMSPLRPVPSVQPPAPARAVANFTF